MNKFTVEKNTLILLSLLKAHNIRKIIASPGTTNVAFVASAQADPWFQIYSDVDERSAAYLACGLAEETGEAVVLSCTQATASRNYLSGLTEAYYRHLPVLAVTSLRHIGRIGQNMQQVIDRSQMPVDTTKLSVQIPVIHTEEDEWAVNVAINNAILELSKDDGGPVHIDLVTEYSREFTVSELPKTRVITRITAEDQLPKIQRQWRVAIFVGAHSAWSKDETEAIDVFCKKFGSVVLCDQTSNYRGKYRINPSLLFSQIYYTADCADVDLLIHIGQTSGAVSRINPKRVWRVNPDGIVRDTFKKLTYVFQMSERAFFLKMVKNDTLSERESTINSWSIECKDVLSKLPELPFSNAWIAKHTCADIPVGSILHLGIYNSLRCWNYFETNAGVQCYANTGGFGIDGGVSSLLGASLASDKMHFMVIGDLAFFYDMNALGNRYIKHNIRILLINNGCGTEFKNPDNRAYELGEDADAFIAAAGHFGNKSRNLVKQYVTALGFQYMTASSKNEYLEKMKDFLSGSYDTPLVFEVFTDSVDETLALKQVYATKLSKSAVVKNAIRSVVGETVYKATKTMIKG